jgi:uncharacterized membrane protein YkoI
MMQRLVSIALGAMLAAAAGLGGAPALAQSGRDDQGEVRKDVREGNVRTLRQIEQSVLPRMRGAQYLGPEYDSTAMVYRLKFIRDGRVTFVDVDARSGRILGISK